MSAPRRPWLCLIAFCLLLWLPGFFTIPATDREESRIAQTSRQMLAVGNVPSGDKRLPPAIHWLQAAAVATTTAIGLAHENPIWPYRIPSALGALGAVLALFGQGRRIAGDGTAWCAAAMLAACIPVIVETHLAKADAVLLGGTSLAMLLLARAYLDPPAFTARNAAGFWLALGAAILVKGPAGPAIAALSIAALLIADRRGGWLLRLRPAWGIPLALLTAAPWLIAVRAGLPVSIVTEAGQHWGPPGLYLLISPALLFPATIPVLLAARGLWAERTQPLTRFLLAWIIPAWIMFEAFPTKLPHYVLPLLPAIFLLAARWLCRTEIPPVSPHWRRFAIAVGMAVAGLLGLAGLALPFLLGTGYWRAIPPVLAALVMLWRARTAFHDDGRRAMRRMILAMPLLTWAALELLLPAMRPLWISTQVVAALAAEGRPAGRFATAGFHEPSLVFLAGADTLSLKPNAVEANAAFLDAAPDRTILIAAAQCDAFLRAAAAIGLTPRPIAEVAGFNYAAGHWESLTLFAR